MKALSMAVASSLIGAPALAGEGVDPQRRDTITVTAEHVPGAGADVAGRLGLTIRETPATIDVLTQEDLQIKGARTAIEAMNAAPGVQAGNLPGSVGSVSMRGFHRAINYLYDGVRMASSDVGVRNWDSWSFERIEVIKGPASVTSGEGPLAGAINFVPRRPHLGGADGQLLASYGSSDSARLAGDVNLPLSRSAAMRASASHSRSSGWVDDTASKTLAGTLSALLQPDDRLSVTVSAEYFEDHYSTAYYGTPVVSRAVARNPSNAVTGSAGLVLDKAMRDVNFNVSDAQMKSDSVWLRARADYELSRVWRITSDTSWYKSDRSWRDADEYSFNAATGLIDRGASFIAHDHQFWNQRVHLAADGAVAGHRNRFSIGVEAGKTDFLTVRRFGSAGAVDPLNPMRGIFPADTAENFTTRQDMSAEVRALAVFAENAFNLTPAWLLVGGLRYDDIELERRVVNVTSGAAMAYGQDYAPLTWRLGTVYSLRPEMQLYAQYTRAVAPVGALLFLSAANAAFDLTTGKSLEGGIKTSLAGGRVRLAASLFHIRQDDILTRDPANPAIVFQGGAQTSTGGEFSLDWAATDEVSIALSGTLLRARLRKLIEAGGLDRSGNRPPNVAERLADFVVTYAPKAMPLSLTGSVRHNGDFYTANANTVRVRGYTTIDAAIAWKAPFGTITLRGRNLTGKFYADWSGYAPGLVFVGAPRSVELAVTAGF